MVYGCSSWPSGREHIDLMRRALNGRDEDHSLDVSLPEDRALAAEALEVNVIGSDRGAS